MAAGVATVTSANIGVATVTGDLTVEGNLNVTGDISYDEVSGRNLNITGVGTITNLGVTSFTATDSTLGVATITAADIDATTIEFASITDETVGVSTIGYADITDAAIGVATITAADIDATTIDFATITDANIGVATVGLASVTELEVSTVVGYSGTFTDLKVTGAVSLPGIPIQGGDAEFRNLNITGLSSFAGLTTFTSDVFVDGNLTVSGIRIEQTVAGENLLVTGIATIVTGIFTGINVSGASTLNEADITTASIDDATIAFADIIDGQVGVLTLTTGRVTGDLTVEGNLNVTGDITYDEVAGRNLNISGVGTINQLGVNTFTAVDASVGVATIGYADVTDLAVSISTISEATIGVATVTDLVATASTITTATIEDATVAFIDAVDATVGVLTVTTAKVTGDLEVDGDFTLTGDVVLDEISSRNLEVTGIATIASLEAPVLSATDATVGVLTVTTVEAATLDVSGVSTFSGQVNLGGNINISGITTTVDLDVTQNAQIAGIATIGFATITDTFIGVATASSLKVTGDLEVEGDFALTGDVVLDELEARGLVVTGIATINDLEVNILTGGNAGFDSVISTFVSADSLNAGVATITRAEVGFVTATNLFVSGVVTSTAGFEGNLTGNTGGTHTGDQQGDVYSRDGSQLVLEVPASTGTATYTGNVTGDITGDLLGDSAGTHTGDQNGDVYTADGATLVVDTAAVPAPVFKGDAEGLTGTPDIVVRDIESRDITSSGVATLTSANIGVATITGDLTVEGDLNVTGDISYDEVTGRNLSISGITTLNTLNINGFTTFDKAIGVALTVTDLVVTGIATLNGVGIATEGGDVEFNSLNISGVATVGVLSTADALIGVATVGLASVKNLDFTTGNGFELEVQSLTVPIGGFVSLPGIPVSGGSATFAELSVTGVSTFGGIATFTNDVYVDGNLFVTGDQVFEGAAAVNLAVSGVLTANNINSTGIVTFADARIEDATIGFADVTDLAAGVATVTVANVTTLNSTDATIGFVTATDMWVSGMITAQDINSLSDRRVKENIRIVENPLEKVEQINGVHFDFINSNRPSMGVIAQEVEEVFPELIAGTFPKSVNYNGLIAVRIESVKELKAQNENLDERIKKLEG